MYFTMSCPDCDKSLKVRDELVGKTARCPHCRSSITVKRPEKPAGGTKAGQATKEGGVAQTPESVARARVLSVTANTNVNVGLYALFGLAATVVFYLLLLPFAGPADDRSYLGRVYFSLRPLSLPKKSKVSEKWPLAYFASPACASPR